MLRRALDARYESGAPRSESFDTRSAIHTSMAGTDQKRSFTSKFTGLCGFSRRPGGMMGWASAEMVIIPHLDSVPFARRSKMC